MTLVVVAATAVVAAIAMGAAMIVAARASMLAVSDMAVVNNTPVAITMAGAGLAMALMTTVWMPLMPTATR